MDFSGGSVGLYSDPSELVRQRGIFGFQKHGRSSEVEDSELRSLKMARNDGKTAPFLLGSSCQSLYPDGEQMLSFSSASKQDANPSLMPAGDGALLPSYYNTSVPASPSPAYLWHAAAGMYGGGSNMSLPGVLARMRGPFTPSQWLELEQQALIYKYIVANAPIPASLLIPIRRSLSTSGFNPYNTAGSFGSSSLGWGPFHLGYSGNADPEPGRCRRTDGKKWRCSRDAVADQKYCERHMNRGRHRSRKHVEGHNGHAAKTMPTIASSQPASTVCGGGSTGSLGAAHQQAKSMLPNATANICTPQFSRTMLEKEDFNDIGHDSDNLSMLTSLNPKPAGTLFPISKQHNPFESSSARANFGLVSADSLLNAPSSSSDNISFAGHQNLCEQQQQSHPLRHFIDDWPKTQSDRSSIWPEVEEMHSDRTQLSISIPVASSDLSSSSSPNNEQLTLSPLKLSREYDHVPMGLGVGMMNEVIVNQHKTSWNPISWEASMAGPLGEVLTSTNNPWKDQSRILSASSLNLLPDGWDSSPRMGSSPTGVLQKTSYDSLSSSTRSSPRVEKQKTRESTGSLCDNLLGSTTTNPLVIPSL